MQEEWISFISQVFGYFLIEEVLAIVGYSVIPANPGSGSGQAPESRIV